MKSSRFRLGVCFLSAIQMIFVFLTFTAADSVGSAYNMRVRGLGDALPVLTQSVALPLLRVRAGDPHNRPVTEWWVWLVWLTLFCLPAVTAVACLRARTPEAEVRRFVLGFAATVTFAVGTACIIALALVTPFACL
jgi:hypothetical protein